MQNVDSAPRPAAVIITVAPVDYAHLDAFPSAAALAEDICASHAAGAAVVHFHVTDPKGAATSDTTFFDGVVEQVRERSDIIVQASTGGVGVPWEVRTASLKARNIEMASLNMGSCNLFGRAYINTPGDIAALGTSMAEAKVVPDMCFFEPGFFTSLDALENRVPPVQRNVYSLCLGFPGTLPATVANLAFMMSKLPSGAEWTLVHHGAPDFALLAAAVSAGGNIRVGFEDSRELGAGARATRNAELVVRAAALVRQLGRTVATPAEVRRRYAIRVPAVAAPAKAAALSRG